MPEISFFLSLNCTIENTEILWNSFKLCSFSNNTLLRFKFWVKVADHFLFVFISCLSSEPSKTWPRLIAKKSFKGKVVRRLLKTKKVSNSLNLFFDDFPTLLDQNPEIFPGLKRQQKWVLHRDLPVCVKPWSQFFQIKLNQVPYLF